MCPSNRAIKTLQNWPNGLFLPSEWGGRATKWRGRATLLLVWRGAPYSGAGPPLWQPRAILVRPCPSFIAFRSIPSPFFHLFALETTFDSPSRQPTQTDTKKHQNARRLRPNHQFKSNRRLSSGYKIHLSHPPNLNRFLSSSIDTQTLPMQCMNATKCLLLR